MICDPNYTLIIARTPTVVVTQFPAQWSTIMPVPTQWPAAAVGPRYQPQGPLLPQQSQGPLPQAPHIPCQGPPTTPTPLLPPPAPIISLTQNEASTHLPLAEKEKRIKAWIDSAKEEKKERKINRDEFFDSDTE